mmetsp:Transcript_86848/g.120492  ORF Transcript_86848/g.120492 Transcript_86848/m.120492 type:complete len:109 (+) Transcript_86848:243-569(+)
MCTGDDVFGTHQNGDDECPTQIANGNFSTVIDTEDGVQFIFPSYEQSWLVVNVTCDSEASATEPQFLYDMTSVGDVTVYTVSTSSPYGCAVSETNAYDNFVNYYEQRS